MDPILFYGVPEGCSFGSIVALEWAGRPYRLCRIALPEMAASPAYRRVNPVGETPALMTATGAIIVESMAILNHIGAGAIDRGLAFPQGSAGFDRLNQALAFLNTSFFNAFTPLWHTLDSDVGEPEKTVLTAFGHRMVAEAHADLERMLDGRDWILGERRSLADAYFAGIARWVDVHDALDRRAYPAVNRLYERLCEDPAVRFARAVEHGEPAVTTGRFAGHVSLDDALSPAVATSP
ncbi:glutathione S-transferase family protein [Azospirillum halopraeferens]|uniref:glutathione S-transferase family protein n=1 Tax=Azospirillum halopraeferens TaxID=34010 RepID=UPI00048B37AD|nr:glutathione S-transferase family protein [Azospirillum halopraeferens]